MKWAIAGGSIYVVLRFVFGVDWWISYSAGMIVSIVVYWAVKGRQT